MFFFNLFVMKVTVFFWLFILSLSFVSLAETKEQLLVLSTNTLVTEDGNVRIHLTLKNNGKTVLYNVQPMIHFHHTMAMLSKIVQIEPGQKITLENADHPPVLRSGRYPLVIMAKYMTDERTGPITQIHTDSFYFREQVESVIDGKINVTLDGDESLLEIFLKNNSASFKNIRLMLLLPPDLKTDELSQMMALTIRGGQEKKIEVAVKRKQGSAATIYPVYLLVEYAEMLNHYTGDISSEIDFRSARERAAIIPALGAMIVLSCFLFFLSYRKKRKTSFPAGG